MIKIKVFPIQNYEAANSFMDMYEPRSTEKSNGIIFHEGNIVIVYDNGTRSKDAKIKRIINLLEKEKDDLMNNSIVLSMSEDGLKRLAPQGFDFKLSDSELKKKIEAANPTLKYNEIKMIMDQIAVYGNQVLKSKFTVEQLKENIASYEKMIAEEQEKSKTNKKK